MIKLFLHCFCTSEASCKHGQHSGWVVSMVGGQQHCGHTEVSDKLRQSCVEVLKADVKMTELGTLFRQCRPATSHYCKPMQSHNRYTSGLLSVQSHKIPGLFHNFSRTSGQCDFRFGLFFRFSFAVFFHFSFRFSFASYFFSFSFVPVLQYWWFL